MKKIKLTCLAIVLCGIFSVTLVNAEGDGGGDFDGGFDGGDFGGDYGGDFDPGGHSDYFEQSDFDSSDAFYQHDQFNQPEDFGSVDAANHESHSGETGMTNQSNDFAIEDTASHRAETAPNGDGFAPESLKKELSDQAADLAQTHTTDQRNDVDTNPNAHPGAASADSMQSTGASDSAGSADNVTTGIDSSTQTDTSVQNVNTQNNTQIDQNAGHDNHQHHHHHGGGHHYYDNFGLGFGLGLGIGFGGPFGYYSPLAPFGYYGGFGVPFNSFGFYGGRAGGFYGNYAGFGLYRYFEPYYPLGGYPAASPVFSAPLRTPTYVQRNDVSRPAAPQQKNYWYYCRNPEGYYPYVKQCAEQWIKVPPQPS